MVHGADHFVSVTKQSFVVVDDVFEGARHLFEASSFEVKLVVPIPCAAGQSTAIDVEDAFVFLAELHQHLVEFKEH